MVNGGNYKVLDDTLFEIFPEKKKSIYIQIKKKLLKKGFIFNNFFFYLKSFILVSFLSYLKKSHQIT